jgi:hypothetical protein
MSDRSQRLFIRLLESAALLPTTRFDPDAAFKIVLEMLVECAGKCRVESDVVCLFVEGDVDPLVTASPVWWSALLSSSRRAG